MHLLLKYKLKHVICNVLFLGTPATVSQMAKDVCTFLKWAAGKSCCVCPLTLEDKGDH